MAPRAHHAPFRPERIKAVKDAAWQQRSQPRNFSDSFRASHPYSLKYTEAEAQLPDIGAHGRIYPLTSR